MIFHQLFDPESSTYTYLIGCPRTRRAVLVDPVVEQVDDYVALLEQLDLRLLYTLETHVHADHVTGADALRSRLGSRSVVHRDAGAACADLMVTDGVLLQLGDLDIEVIATPGHTAGCVSYRIGDRVLTGDALFIGGTGRTDFQEGDAGRLYDSITTRLFTLPPDTLVFPGHDYKGNTVSTVRQEMERNPRVGGGKSRNEFIAIMNNLNLPPPRHIARAVPANQACGRELQSH